MPFPDPQWIRRIESFLRARLREVAAPPRLLDAMEYALLGGGKRLRPQLVYAAGEATGGDTATLDYAAAAVEMIHAYSLVHDDLPAMDDDTLRHGQPTVHIAFDEATAILIGDGLQALAFETAAAAAVPDAVVRTWCAALAHAAGAAGMVGGQILDLEAEGRSVSEASLEAMHRKKTGALIGAAVAMGAYRADLELRSRLSHFALDVGLAFQITDDVLDVTASSELMGKDQNSDVDQAKSTYVTLLGVDASRRAAQDRVDGALASIADLDERAAGLRSLARYAIERSF